MDVEEYRAYVRKLIDEKFDGSQSAAAKAWGLSPAYVCDLLAGRREPGPAFLKPLGFEAVVTYRRVATVRKGA